MLYYIHAHIPGMYKWEGRGYCGQDTHVVLRWDHQIYSLVNCLLSLTLAISKYTFVEINL